MFEPLVGELFRSGFVMQAAAPQGDFVTPTIMGAGESDAAREQRGARALFRMLADDEAHGAANQEIDAGLAGGRTRRRRVDAARSCSRSGRSCPRRSSASRTRFERSRERAATSLLGDIGLETPKEVHGMTEFASRTARRPTRRASR